MLFIRLFKTTWSLLLIALLFALPSIDPDLGWFIRCGQEPCAQNHFSVLLPEFLWFRPMIIYPKIINFLYYHFSFWGLTAFNILIGLFSFYFFHKITKTNISISAIAFSVSTLLSFSVLSLGLRNQNLSLLFFLATVYFLTSKKYLLLIPLFILWANTHPGFPIGLALIFISSLSNLRNLVYLASAFLGTLINPFGYNIYKDIISHYTTPMNTLIAEWTAPSLANQILIISLFCVFLISVIIKKYFSIFYTLSLAVFSFLALTARRNLPFFYYFLPLALIPSLSLSRFKNIIFLISLPIFFFACLSILPKTIDINSNWNSYCSKGITNFPCEAAEFLKSQPPGNIFNTYEWGGFLIWQLPNFKVFIDGRMPAWSNIEVKNPYQLYLSTYQTQPGWQDTLEKYKIDYILIAPNTFLDLELKTNKHPWKEIFKSEFSVIYKKN